MSSSFLGLGGSSDFVVPERHDEEEDFLYYPKAQGPFSSRIHYSTPTHKFVTQVTKETPHLKHLVLVGPSGSGKSTLVKHLMAIAPDRFKYSISSTTR